MSLLQVYEYPNDDLQPMHNLLKEWGLECLYQTLLDELIDMKVLKIMKPEHVNELLNKYPIGIKILFNHNLKKWQETLPQNVYPTTHAIQQITSDSAKTFPQQKLVADDNINLCSILKTSNTGVMIFNYYKTNSKFNDNIRSLLVDTIISYIITKKIPMSVKLADYIGDQIVDMFPSEVKDSYFMKCEGNKNPKGKLYAKYYNSMRALKSSGLMSSNSRVKRSHVKNRQYDVHFEPEKDIDDIVDQIKHYDNNCAFEKLENNWKATTKFRLIEIQKTSSVSDIINNWSGFASPLGHRLVDIDFNTLHPLSLNLLSTFEGKCEQIINLLNEKIKDSTSRKFLDTIKSASDISKNGINTVLFYLLHAIFVPTSKKVTRDHTGKKSQVKYSIKDSQNSFMVFINSVSEMDKYVATRYNKKNPDYPLILIVGLPMSPEKIVVLFDSLKYPVFTILKAVDVSFKLFHLFNIDYPSESCIVWLFIQKYFYNLNTKFDKACHTLGQILFDLSAN